MTFAKLHQEIVQSSIWATPYPVRLVWVTMLAMSDEHGFVGASLSGLARLANVTLGECSESVQALLSPDPESRTKDHEGRRIREAERGWVILNYPKFRAMCTAADRTIQNREAKRRQRDRERSGSEETKADTEVETSAPVSIVSAPVSVVPADVKPAKPAKKATSVDPESDWSPEQTEKLRAIGRDPRVENEAFIARHESLGTLSYKWASNRATWIINARDRGYGAPARQTPPGLVAHAARKGLPAESPVLERPEHTAYRHKVVNVAPVGTAGEASAKLMASLRKQS